MFRHRSKPVFLKNKSGNVAPFFGLLAIPMLAITGGSVDMGRAVSAEKVLQSAVDTAALAVCSASHEELPDDVVKAFLAASVEGSALTYNGSSTTHSDPAIVELTQVGFNPDENSVNPKARATLNTSILKLIGIPSIELNASAKVNCGGKRLELSMVLDVTGSMNGSIGGKTKLQSMKDAGHEVLDIFARNMTAGVTRVALVPFSDAVNVGADIAEKVRGTIDSGESSVPGKTKLKFDTGRHDQHGNDIFKTYESTSCVAERTGVQAYTKVTPICSGNQCSNPVGHVYMKNGVCRPQNQFKPLSDNTGSLRAAIDSYQGDGWTAGHIGAAWGWYALQDTWGNFWPNNAAEPVNEDELIKATIIMTDGEFNTEYKLGVQTRDRPGNSPNGSSKNQFEEICESINENDIVVFTVGFGLDPNGATAARLRDCASEQKNFFLTNDGEGLKSVFNAISRKLASGQAIVEE